MCGQNPDLWHSFPVAADGDQLQTKPNKYYGPHYRKEQGFR